jgi:hypothetical protein
VENGQEGCFDLNTNNTPEYVVVFEGIYEENQIL